MPDKIKETREQLLERLYFEEEAKPEAIKQPLRQQSTEPQQERDIPGGYPLTGGITRKSSI